MLHVRLLLRHVALCNASVHGQNCQELLHMTCMQHALDIRPTQSSFLVRNMPCRLSSLLLARHVLPQRSIQIYRSVLEILLVIFEFARKKNGDKMFRVQTHQVLLTCNLTCTLRIAIFMHLGRQISRCFWVLDHLKNLTCRAFSRLSGMA